ncbi:MAG TPA: hypothetical protein VGC49_08245 [Solirubrobacterales bacterium]
MFRRGEKIDPLGRQAALGLAAGRLAAGAGALLATRPALRAIGFPEPGATGWSLAKVLGARDLTMGGLTVAAREDRAALRAATFIATALDAADVIAFGLAAGDPETRRAGAAGAATAAAAVVGGIWALHRLGRA